MWGRSNLVELDNNKQHQRFTPRLQMNNELRSFGKEFCNVERIDSKHEQIQRSYILIHFGKVIYRVTVGINENIS